MHVTSSGHNSTPPFVGLIASLGFTTALVGTYWDDSWHTDKGRDQAFIAPHLLLYGGVLIAALAVAAWGIRAWARAGWGLVGVRAVLQDPALLLAGIGGATTLASAPIDAAWHSAFGRDAVLWSPSHLTAVLGTLALSVGLLAGLRQSTGRGAATARVFAAAAVIGTLQMPVLEYDSDVPQFGVEWFLPVAALGVCLAIVLLHDLLPDPRQLVAAATVYTALRVGVVGLLAALDHSLTMIPPVVVVLALDAALWRRGLPTRLVIAGSLTPLVWWPALQLQDGVTTVVPAAQLPVAIALGAGAGLLVALAHGDLSLQRQAATRAVVLVAGVVLALIPGGTERAWAHDPGQGQQVQQVTVTIDRRADTATLDVAVPRCAGLQPVAIVARRAGAERRAPLALSPNDGGCSLSGSVAGLGAGRWFVYAELADSDGRALETWLAVAPDSRITEKRSLYALSRTVGSQVQTLAGAGLLGVVAALLVACLRLARRTAATAPG